MTDPSWRPVESADADRLPLEAVLGERRDPVPKLSSEPDPGLLLMFTVDTECSILRQPNPDPDRVVDELIFGDFANGQPPGGIGLHMDLLEHFGFRGCFFVDVLMEHRYGQRALERTVEAIAERGHEIQLHLHTDQLAALARDPVVRSLDGAISSPDIDRFRRALELSVGLFERRVGRRPIAYRAGGFRIADTHFPVLEEFGIRIDSSVCREGARSRVADWMRTRTQPFWVGNVLEAPPTHMLLTDDPSAWTVCDFVPSSGLGDPVSSMPPPAARRPLVATYVSHSFQFLTRTETRAPEEIAAFVERVRSALPADIASRLERWSPKMARSFGEALDSSVVAAAAGILRRIADRSDARCATYTELASVTDRFWSEERHPPVDPIPLLDRRRGVSGVAGSRVYSRDLLSHLAVGARDCADDGDAGADAGRSWVESLERCEAPILRQRIDAAIAELEPRAALLARFRTLGAAAPRQRGTLPPLCELLFPEADVRAVAAEMGAEVGDAVAWDAPTFVAWLKGEGFEVSGERRVPREPGELEGLDRFADKLRWLDPRELRTAALEVELRPPPSASAHRATPGPLLEFDEDEPTRTALLHAHVDPAQLPAAAAELYESTRPGHELRLELPDEPAPASRTTILLALMRVGFEILSEDGSGYRITRPLELSDLRRFAGLE